MAKRGFFAELNYQAQQAEKRRRQQEAAAVRAHNAAVREVERAERAGKVQSIALIVGVNRVAPATGLPETVPLVQVAADRKTFIDFDLSQVVAKATLEHLGAALSKSPFDLTPADTSRGVRQRNS